MCDADVLAIWGVSGGQVVSHGEFADLGFGEVS